MAQSDVVRKFLIYFGDSKPRTPLEYVKACVDMAIPMPQILCEAVEEFHGKGVWETLGGVP